MEAKDLNRLKIILSKRKKTKKWQAEQIEKVPVKLSKWCFNILIPSLEILLQIANVLDAIVIYLLQYFKEEINNVRILES